MNKRIVALSADHGEVSCQQIPALIEFLHTWKLSFDCWSCGNSIAFYDPFNMNSKNVETLSFRDYGALTSKRISNLDVIYSQFKSVIKESVNNIDCLFAKNLSDNSAGPLTKVASFKCHQCNTKYLMLYHIRPQEEYRSPESRTSNSITILEIISGGEIVVPEMR